MKLEIVFKDGRKAIFDSVASFNVTEEQTANEEYHASEVAQTPTEGKLFEVNPLEIDRSKFEEPTGDPSQEWRRWTIQEAFAEVDKNPEEYALPFYTLIPEKKYSYSKTVEELKEYANDLGGLVADWVQQALEWAQRLVNGESWESICNHPDTANWYRMIIWKNGYAHLVGGSRYDNNFYSASNLSNYGYYSYDRVYNTVPLVVIKKK